MPTALDATLYYARRRRRQFLRPEDLNPADELFPGGASTAPGGTAFTAAAAFGCDLIIAANAQGMIFGAGNATTGALVGIDANGDLIARFGDGANPPATNFARIVIPSAIVPRARTVRLGWAYILDDSCVVWIDGIVAGRAFVTGSPSAWSASSNIAFLHSAAIVGPTESGVSDFAGTFNITAQSTLRYLARRVEVF